MSLKLSSYVTERPATHPGPSMAWNQFPLIFFSYYLQFVLYHSAVHSKLEYRYFEKDLHNLSSLRTFFSHSRGRRGKLPADLFVPWAHWTGPEWAADPP